MYQLDLFRQWKEKGMLIFFVKKRVFSSLIAVVKFLFSSLSGLLN